MSNQGSGVTMIPTISRDAATKLIEMAAICAKQEEVSGYITISSSTGLHLGSRMVGDRAHQGHINTANDKVETVLGCRHSTRFQRELLENKGYNRTDYGVRIRTLFTGGVAIFDKDDNFIAAIAFSGGTPEQDEEICIFAIKGIGDFGFQTDYDLEEKKAA